MSETPYPPEEFSPEELEKLEAFDELAAPPDDLSADESPPIPDTLVDDLEQLSRQFDSDYPADESQPGDETAEFPAMAPPVSEAEEAPPLETRRRHAMPMTPPDEGERPGQARERERVQEVVPEFVRQQRGGRLSISPLAFGLIGLGALLLAQNFNEEINVTTPTAIVILLGSFVLTTLFRFFESGRRQRGLFFLGTVLLSWGAVVALTTLGGDDFPIDEFWPLTIAGVGASFFFTFLFERNHQAGLVFPAIILMFASAVAFSVTLDVIDQDTLDTVADYWPLVMTILGLLLLPAGLQER